jgi:hypothetical protein
VELEDKQLEGRELDRELRQEERKQDELPVVTEELIDLELAHRGQVVDAVQLILDQHPLAVSRLGLPQREERALAALQAAVAGRDPTLGTFVYAEDRQRLLEQALAVLQQNLAIDERYGDLGQRVCELRHELSHLEEAQDELIDEHREPVMTKPVEDAEPAEESLTDFIASALYALAELPHQSTLDGPEPVVDKRDSSLDGPERAFERPASSLAGAERTFEKPASSLAGPERTFEKPASSLDGPELPEPRKSKSTLAPDPSIVPSVLKKGKS